MAEYPNNSHNARETQRDSSPPDKKVEKVVTSSVKSRKKSEVRKFAGIFVPEDTNSVKSYILMDVVVPGIKNGHCRCGEHRSVWRGRAYRWEKEFWL